MEHLLARSFAKYLCERQIISPEHYDVYVYGTELTLSFIITVSIILVAGLIFGDILGSIIFLVVFIALRRFTGGDHASTYFRCKIITVTVFLLSLLASHMFNVFWWMYVILFGIGIIVICFLAPIENSNKPLSDAEKKKYKLLSNIVFSIMAIIGSLVSLLTKLKLNILWFSMLSVIALMIIPKLTKGEKKNEEESRQNNG